MPLFLFGLKRQGAAFTVYSTYTVLVYAVSAFLITDVLPVDVSLASPLAGEDLLLCALFGGIISGMGGIEVLAVIFAKRLGLAVGTFVMLYNVALYMVCGVVIGSWVLPLYSIVTYMAALKTVDFIVEGIDRSKAAMIVTGKQEEVCSALSETFGCGVTILPAAGYYSGNVKCCAYIILNRFQIGRMKELVHQCDPQAYITITEVADVFTNTVRKPS